jgi:hypothetical protein
MIIIQTYLFFTFCRWMKDEETSSRILVTQIDAGIQPARRNSAYVNLSRRLEDLRQAYLARTSTRSQFLRSCSYTLVQLRMPQPAAEVGEEAAVGQDVPDVHRIIPWQHLDHIIGLDAPAPVWRPWT